MTELAMSGLGRRLEEYLRIRRSLGFKLARDGKLLAQFIGYLHEQGTDTITIDHAVAWVGLPAGAGRGWLAFRMSVVRGFTGYLHTLDPAVPVPPADLFPPGPHRAVPYLYSDDELAALVAATDTLRYPLQRATYRTLICCLRSPVCGSVRRSGSTTTTSTPNTGCSRSPASSANPATFRCTRARRGVGGLPAPPQDGAPTTGNTGVVRVHPGHPADQRERQRDVRHAGRALRAGATTP